MRKSKQEDKEFEEKLSKRLTEEVNNLHRYQSFIEHEKETDYSNSVKELEEKIINQSTDKDIINLMEKFKYNLTQHILIIQEEKEHKMLRLGVRLGSIVDGYKKRKKKKD